MAPPARRAHDESPTEVANRTDVCKSGPRTEHPVRRGWTAGSRGDDRNSADAADLRTKDAALNRMVCEDCGTVYYSGALRTMVERGERCPKCGGRLVLAIGPRPLGKRERSDHSDGPAKA